MEKIELLAPVGSMESLYAAVNNGADAIYLGGPKFSARAKAIEFDNEKMKVAADYCHSYGVKIYVTMNTILKEKELKDAIKYAGYLYEIGIDALIIQDLGFLKLIKEKYPDFEVHASTQMTIHNGEGAVYFTEKGFKRVVLSRELSLEEIEYISKDLGIETEIFVHGALCVSYSGQCLMSSMIGGRSGNRGKCAQPCRQEYKLVSASGGEKKGHLLSTKDTCTIDDMKDIIESGALSLKVEGRMKRPEYVAGVIETYRKAIDKELENREFNVEEGKKTLLQLFNRGGFANAYLKKDSGKDMMSFVIPKNTGLELGKSDDKGEIILQEDITIGDGVGYGSKGFTVSKILLNGKEVLEADKGDKVKLFPKGYKKGDLLYKTSSKTLFDELSEKIKPYYRKISLIGEVRFKVGEEMVLKVSYNGIDYVVKGDMVEKAEKEGKLKSGSTIIEATAGNTGIGIALAAINKGYKIIFIVPNKFSIEKQKIMKALGAEIINTPKEEGMEGAINLANSLLSEIPNSLSLNQFKNEANPLAHYETTGRELYDGLDGQIDYFVAGAGSGGTISGVLKFLKENISEVKGILADPVGSIIGGGQCGTYKIEGIGNNFIPETMDMSLVDDVIKVNDEEAFDAVKLLAKKEGLIVGSSSGAAFAAVLKLAEKIEEGNIVTIFPDRGDRYFSTDLF